MRLYFRIHDTVTGYDKPIGIYGTHGVDISQGFGCKFMHALSLVVENAESDVWTSNELSKEIFEKAKCELARQLRPIRGSKAGESESDTFAHFKNH